MKIISKLSIRAKLAMLVCVALGLLLIAASAGYWGIEQGRKALDEITAKRMVSARHLQTMSEAKTALNAIQVSVFMYESDPEAQGKFRQILGHNREAWARLDTAIDGYQKLSLDADEKTLWEMALQDLVVWRENDERLMRIVQRFSEEHDADQQKGDFQEYFLTYSVAAPLFLKVENSLKAVLEKSVKDGMQAIDSAAEASSRANVVMVTVAGVAIGALVLMGIGVLQAVTIPIRMAIDVASKIAAGNLAIDIETDGKDEMASMLGSLSAMQAELRRIVGVIHSNANQIGGTSELLSTTTERIFGASQQQVSSTKEMAAVVQRMAESISQIANHASDATQLARHSGEISAAGEAVIKDVTAEMGEIAEAVIATAAKVRNLGTFTKEIASIVTVIKEVAEQTNLLALNAAIEAARAGDSGRGFAVVADEVRLLAERTAKSAQQIADTIAQILRATDDAVVTMEAQVGRVTNGAQLAKQAGTAVESINRETTRLVTAVNEISDTLNEQRQANSQVASSVCEIELMSSKNGDAIAECAKSAMLLRTLSQELRNSVERIRLG